MTETPSTPGFHVVGNIPNAIYVTDEEQNYTEVDLDVTILSKSFTTRFVKWNT